MTKQAKWVAGLVVAAWLGGSAWGVTALASEGETVEVTTPAGMCPQEDSCRADYRDGQWHIWQGSDGR